MEDDDDFWADVYIGWMNGWRDNSISFRLSFSEFDLLIIPRVPPQFKKVMSFEFIQFSTLLGLTITERVGQVEMEKDIQPAGEKFPAQFNCRSLIIRIHEANIQPPKPQLNFNRTETDFNSFEMLAANTSRFGIGSF